MKYHEILPEHLFQAAKTNDLSAMEKVTALRELGVSHVINLWHTPDRDLSASFRYDWYSVPDGRLRPSTARVMTLLAKGAATTIRNGGAVLTQCYGGRNRSGLMSALIIRELSGCTGAEARAIVQAARKGALNNVHFTAYLDGLE